MTFLVARPSPKAQSTQLALQEAGLSAEVAPVLEVCTIADSDLRAQFHKDASEILIITSTYAVEWLIKQALTSNLNRYKIICIGQSTADALTSSVSSTTNKVHLKESLILPSNENSEGVLSLPLMQNIEGKSITLLKGQGGRDLIYTAAKSKGAKVNELCVYRRVVKRDQAFDFNLDSIKCIIVTSVDIAKACFALFEPNFLQNIHWMVASQRIKDYAIQQGVVSISQSQGASQSAITQCALYLVHTGVVND